MLTLATPADIPEICALLRLKHASNGMGRVNEAKTLGVVSKHVLEGGCMITRSRGELAASVAIYKNTWWYSDDLAFFDRWFYIHPDHRNEGHAVRMIAALKEACRNTNIPLVLQVESDADAMNKIKLFKKYLFRMGGCFIFDPVKEAA